MGTRYRNLAKTENFLTGVYGLSNTYVLKIEATEVYQLSAVNALLLIQTSKVLYAAETPTN